MNLFAMLSDPGTYRYWLHEGLSSLWPYPAWAWAAVSGVTVWSLVVAKRFRRFNRADWSIASPIVRDWVALPILGISLIAIALIFLAALAIGFLAVKAGIVERVWEIMQSRAYALGAGAVGAAMFGYALIYIVIPRWERVAGLPDVLGRTPVRSRDYDPMRFFDLSRGIFVGLDGSGRASYVPIDKVRGQHFQIVGATGSGKVVAAQVLLPQFAMAGESVWVFDPKDDRRLPEVLSAFCASQRLPFRLIDLRPTAPAQLNLMHKLSVADFSTLLQAGFDLADNGGIDRVYRLDDRNAANNTAALLRDSPELALPEIMIRAATDSTITEARVFFGLLKELAALPAFATREGIRLDVCLDKPGITYVVGSTLDPATLMAQKMVLLRVLQLIYGRPKDGKQRHVALFFDELKYLLSLPSVNALGIIRDSHGHALIAHQSLGDLEACPGIPPAVITGALRDNAKLKLIYQAIDSGTAKWAEELSGTTQRHTETVSKQRRGDSKHHDGHWQTIEVPLIHRNQLLHLPQMTGVLYGDGVARYTTMRPLRQHARRPKPIAAPPIAGPSDVQALI